MIHRVFTSVVLFVLLICSTATAQIKPWLYWTFLSPDQMDEIIGEASGETAWNTIMETGGYNKNRLADEYAGTFYEAEYVLSQLKLYGLSNAEIVRFPGGKIWDAIKGDLWEIEPNRQKLASYQDMTAMLVRGSQSANVTAELVWIGNGTQQEIDRVDVNNKIVVTDGYISRVNHIACNEKGALGIVAISSSRPYFDPLQIPWSRMRGRRSNEPVKFGFYLPVREGDYLKQRLLRGEKIKVHAEIETTMEPYDLQDIVCTIPGTDPNSDEIIFSAHLFEGYTKQGANDNKSGSAAILEVARVLHKLIEEGRLPHPKRTIRFLWGPEFSGTGPWVAANKDIMKRTLCDINMDMVGEWLSKNKASMCLMRTTYANPHYINDVMENYYRFVGEGNRERLQNRGYENKIPHRIVAPSGADEPFYYSIETHYGSSDHEVFNDWSVRVPGIMMIAWPDQWYHTSGDRVDKADPTQLKRVAIIGAAAAYTIASADDDMAIKIAAEITSNATRRLGHQLAAGLACLNRATESTFSDEYKMARIYLDKGIENELGTVESVLELAQNKNRVEDYINKMKKTIRQIGDEQSQVLEIYQKTIASQNNWAPAKIQWNNLEKKSAKMIPKPTEKVMMNGYGGYNQFIDEVPDSVKKQYPYGRRGIASIRELQSLINGERNVLDIKNTLDAQNAEKSNLQSILNYLQILKHAGLIEMYFLHAE